MRTDSIRTVQTVVRAGCLSCLPAPPRLYVRSTADPTHSAATVIHTSAVQVISYTVIVMSALTKKQLEDVVTGLNQRLDGLLVKITALESLPDRLARLEAMLEASNAENAGLRAALAAKDESINFLQLKTNSLEQYNRSWSIRINGLAVTSEEEKDSSLVKKKVFDHLLRPILQGAVVQGDLSDVPPVEQVLEAAHVLPARDARTKPVIARFFIRDIRGLVFKHKKDFASREEATSADRPGRYVYPFFEDLTKVNFTKMREIATHPTVAACWSSRGQLRYKLKDSQEVKKVRCVLDTVDEILA